MRALHILRTRYATPALALTAAVAFAACQNPVEPDLASAERSLGPAICSIQVDTVGVRPLLAPTAEDSALIASTTVLIEWQPTLAPRCELTP